MATGRNLDKARSALRDVASASLAFVHGITVRIIDYRLADPEPPGSGEDHHLLTTPLDENPYFCTGRWEKEKSRAASPAIFVP